MKLVGILAKELDVWPEGVVSYAQDDSEIVGACDGMQVRLYNSHCWTPVEGCKWAQDAPLNGDPVELSSDYQTAIVTKEMWEAEKAKLNVQNMPEAESFDPIYCRDRIKEIDALVESLEEERLSLVQALEDEGFALIGEAIVRASKVEEVKEGMSDWRNWRAGDVVQCTSISDEWSKEHELYSFYHLADNPEYDACGSLHIQLDETGYYVNPADFKWHSRPTTVNH